MNAVSDIANITGAVDEARLGTLVGDLAAFGARPDGGVDRQALTPEDFKSRRFLVDLARSYGAQAYRDSIGNLFFRRPGQDADAAPVVTGSHADSQPTGGRLDGAYGVCAGLEVLAALADSGVAHRRPIEVAVWTNEEGCRFAPGSMGASAFTEPSLLDGFLATADTTGRTVGEELAEADPLFADVPLRPLGTPVHAFVETHIEQGPVMADAGVTIGVVRGIQGTRWYEITVDGIAAHAGSTPRANRQDALRAATEIATGVYAAFDAGDERLRMTIGRLTVGPGSVNVVPEQVRMTVDVRHPEEAVLDAVEERLRELTAAHAGRARLERTMAMPPTGFDGRIRDTVREAARDLKLSAMEIDSGAFHDSLHLARHCPTGMIFVPSVDGLSHNPAEHTALSDLAAGTRVLAASLIRLAQN
ncbi:M20 family metallo-hydrolase [Streptomyces sp. DSM 3412]|uniref:M20 family metallo-hydrolase n=1 Tax=Streptomyces gottesmaniae TaxID=3075518 RepID=A0ABU2Z1X5_9ACTN|nr:M20 family metallo-hydrolase [Streptomyces sp. DSM 3412]MDT0570274.1 M20 family metallo-hydrolase [Streptomyces sp. DSM 3412]